MELSEGLLRDFVQEIDWNRDLTIVALFSEFTIALIPFAWIYLFAVGFARWIVLIFGVLKLPYLCFVLLAAMWFNDGVFWRLLEPTLLIAALILLFLPSTTQWLSNQGEDESAAFD